MGPVVASAVEAQLKLAIQFVQWPFRSYRQRNRFISIFGRPPFPSLFCSGAISVSSLDTYPGKVLLLRHPEDLRVSIGLAVRSFVRSGFPPISSSSVYYKPEAAKLVTIKISARDKLVRDLLVSMSSL